MRLFFGSIASLMLVMLVIGCSWVDPSECWVNTSGGLGGAGMIPIGAGVGATTSGDSLASPPRGPLDSNGTPNPCVASDNSSRGGGDKVGHVLTPDEQAAIALADADPAQLARAQLRADYAAYAVKGLVEADISDPSTVDESTLNKLVNMYTPIAWEQAGQWISTVDPSEVPLAQVKPKDECQQKFGCDATTTCDFEGYTEHAYCVLTNCGEGKCPVCPSWFGFDKLIIKNWCSYTCMIDYQIVGLAVTWNFAITHERTVCVKLEKPVPCEGVCRP